MPATRGRGPRRAPSAAGEREDMALSACQRCAFPRSEASRLAARQSSQNAPQSARIALPNGARGARIWAMDGGWNGALCRALCAPIERCQRARISALWSSAKTASKRSGSLSMERSNGCRRSHSWLWQKLELSQKGRFGGTINDIRAEISLWGEMCSNINELRFSHK